MAKKKHASPRDISGGDIVAGIAASTTPKTQVIKVPEGGSLTVIIDVGPMTIPYSVSYVGRTVIKSLVDRAETLDLKPGSQILGWAFAHASKGWSHTIAVSVSGGAPKVLESRSEEAKDQDSSVGFAVIEA